MQSTMRSVCCVYGWTMHGYQPKHIIRAGALNTKNKNIVQRWFKVFSYSIASFLVVVVVTFAVWLDYQKARSTLWYKTAFSPLSSRFPSASIVSQLYEKRAFFSKREFDSLLLFWCILLLWMMSIFVFLSYVRLSKMAGKKLTQLSR